MTLALALLFACAPPPEDEAAFSRVPDAGDVDPLAVRLCDPVDESAPDFDSVNLRCAVEGFRYATEAGPPDGPLQVMAFNVERGHQLDRILDAFATGALPQPDVLLASELDRGCARTGGRHVARELGAALGMDVAFGVEFVELPRGEDREGQALCEHGNAILSRYPLGDVAHRFHAANLSWYQPPDARDGGEPRLGGRSFVVGDVDLGDRRLRAVSFHFESQPSSWADVLPAQAAEAAAAASGASPAVVGGDSNFPAYTFDLARGDGEVRDASAAAVLDAGLTDLHAALPFDARPTHGTLVLDLVFGRGLQPVAPTVCEPALCDGLSDHEAVWVGVE